MTLTYIAKDILVQKAAVACFTTGMLGRIGHVFPTLALRDKVKITDSTVRFRGVLEVSHLYEWMDARAVSCA